MSDKKIVFFFCLFSIMYFLRDVTISTEEIKKLDTTGIIESVLSKKETDHG